MKHYSREELGSKIVVFMGAHDVYPESTEQLIDTLALTSYDSEFIEDIGLPVHTPENIDIEIKSMILAMIGSEYEQGFPSIEQISIEGLDVEISLILESTHLNTLVLSLDEDYLVYVDDEYNIHKADTK